MLPYITDSHVNKLVTWDKLLPVLRASLVAYYEEPSSPRSAIQPLRTNVQIPKHNGSLLLMPGYIPRNDALAVKVITIYPNNAEKGLSTHSGIIILFDGATGIPRALLDAEAITAHRTAAVSALVSLCLGHKKCERIAILGSGIQGGSHVRALHHFLQPSEICIWSRNVENASKLVKGLQKEGINAKQYDQIEKCVCNCAVISTCTLSPTPILKKEWIGNNTHINAVGAAGPNLQELDPDIMKSAKVYVDSIESASNESGDIILSKIKDMENLKNLLQNMTALPKSGITVFKNLGLAVEDAATADLIFNLYNEQMKSVK